MEGDNIVYYPKKLPDGTVKRYRTCRACRNESQRKSKLKRYRAAATARKLAAIEAAKHCDHCRNQPRAVDIAYVSTLARTIVELGGKVPPAPDEIMWMEPDHNLGERKEWTSE